jgi:16S rRNA (guanine527-N7)-methyltransferase
VNKRFKLVSRARQETIDFEADKAQALLLTPVSRETQERLERFVEILFLWQKKTNLIASSTLPKLWTRHIADSLQLLDLAPERLQTWVDFGSGGGFPAIPIACALTNRPGIVVHLIESNRKKAAFLREAIRLTSIPAHVHQERVENFVKSFGDNVQVVSARALSSLKTLCDQSFPLIAKGAIGLFPRGRDVEVELTETTKYWNIETDVVPSKTSREGYIVVVRALSRKATIPIDLHNGKGL